MHGNREILVLSASADRSEKVRTRTSDMYDTGKSDRLIVPKKPANNAGPRPLLRSRWREGA